MRNKAEIVRFALRLHQDVMQMLLTLPECNPNSPGRFISKTIITTLNKHNEDYNINPASYMYVLSRDPTQKVASKVVRISLDRATADIFQKICDEEFVSKGLLVSSIVLDYVDKK